MSGKTNIFVMFYRGSIEVMDDRSWMYRDSPQGLRRMDYCNGVQGFINFTTSIPRNFTDTTRKPEKTNGITDGLNSVSKSVGIYLRNTSVGDTIGIYRWKIFRRYILTVSLTDYFFRRFYRRNDRGIQTEIVVQ